MANVDLNQLVQSVNYAVSQSKEAAKFAQQVAQNSQMTDARVQQMMGYAQALRENTEQLLSATSRLSISGSCGDPKIQHIESIPGRRVPFDYLVDIPIPANQVGTIQQSITISQEGPFVAVSRMVTLVSAMQYTVTDGNNNVLAFNGRSFGRYRPTHSAWDLNDGKPHVDVYMAAVNPGNGAPSFTSPSNTSSFRTMEGDFRIMTRNAGSAYPRSNIEVPSTFWSKNINEPFDLAALDLFERGEVITFEILPLHPNNPSYGNVNGYAPLNNAFPFTGSQFDAVEGINDPAQADPSIITDPVTRNPAAILTIGFHGYRIIQPPGVGPR
jgi:hypothetical protein